MSKLNCERCGDPIDECKCVGILDLAKLHEEASTVDLPDLYQHRHNKLIRAIAVFLIQEHLNKID